MMEQCHVNIVRMGKGHAHEFGKCGDLGVYYKSGQCLIPVRDNPFMGQYTFDKEKGRYEFCAFEDGRKMLKIYRVVDGSL